MGWFDANEYCLAEYGTQLATVSSPDLNFEAAYANNVFGSRYGLDSNCSFIGLHALHQPLDWQWIDNDDISNSGYTHWANDELHDSDNERCAYMCNQGSWYPVSCQLQCDHCSIL